MLQLKTNTKSTQVYLSYLAAKNWQSIGAVTTQFGRLFHTLIILLVPRYLSSTVQQDLY